MKNRSANRSTRRVAPLEGLEPRLVLSATFPADTGQVQPVADPNAYLSQSLTARQVGIILSQAASQALPGQVITVTNREGVILGQLTVAGSTASQGVPSTGQDLINKSVARARTAAFFESTQNAFTTRTARFIIQNNFPDPIPNTPGGPLYGVEFSDIQGTDVLLPDQVNDAGYPTTLTFNGASIDKQLGDISGDPGGIPLYIDGIPVGGIGVAGDGSDIAVLQSLDTVLKDVPALGNGKPAFFGDTKVPSEEPDQDEAVALSGAQGFQPNPEIQASNIFAGGLRLPYTAEGPADSNPYSSLPSLVSSNAVTVDVKPINAPADPYPTISFHVPGQSAPISGQLKNITDVDNVPTVRGDGFQQPYGVVAGVGAHGQKLTISDVETIIRNAAATALQTRAGIRQPLGVPVRVHISVVDTQGNILADFAMADATDFSNDIAVQKARTALYFSDNKHAFSSTAIGFLSQGYFPVGTSTSTPGPLYELQNALSVVGPSGTALNFKGPLRNGITIFPGGVPLYKNGILVGAIGVSGDGVTQDDYTAAGGATGYAAPLKIRDDTLGDTDIASFLIAKLNQLSDYGIDANILSSPLVGNTQGANPFTQGQPIDISTFDQRLLTELHDVRLPYQNFPRNPKINK